MRILTSALALSTVLAAATPALAANPGDQPGGPGPRMEEMQNGPQNFGPRRDGPGRLGMHQPPRGPHGPGHGGRPGGPLKLAEKLSAMETAIGIRSDQLNVWRDFTDALQGVMQPPKPPAPEDRKTQPDALEMALTLADHMAEKGKKAEELKTAIEALRNSLSPEQLERVKQIRLPMAPRMGPGNRHGQPPLHGRGDHGPRGPRAAGR